MIPRIIWLASYPKSGNTWLRIFLSNLVEETDEPSDINNLRHNSASFTRHAVDEILGFDTADFNAEDCARFRPIAYRWMSAQQDAPIFCKAHEACERLSNGDWLMAPDATDKVVYILRNPLDIVVSMSHFNQITLDAAICILCDAKNTLSRQVPTRQAKLLEQPIGTWSHHVQSWVSNDLFNTCPIRYEDLSRSPHTTFAKIARFVGLTDDPVLLDQAVQNSSFDQVKKQETASDFCERPRIADSFFRRGEVGEWKTVLSGPQIDKVIQNHWPVMEQFGYVDRNGTPQLG